MWPSQPDDLPEADAAGDRHELVIIAPKRLV
jgi:hypothetical protein